jgi:hypothetical protein
MAETQSHYSIVRVADGWGVRHDDATRGNFLTKEAAFEAAVAAASNAIREGRAVTISVEGARSGEPALGAG